MLKILLIFSFLFFILGCDAKKPPKEVDLDLIYDVVTPYNEQNTTAPYSHKKFQDVLNQANYQYPHSVTIVDHGAYDGYKTDAFYVDANGDWYFTLNKEHNTTKERSELRQVCKDPKTGQYTVNAGWKTSDKEGNFWIADVRCFKPKETQSYTWMQVHGVNGMDITLNDGTVVKSFNYPIIRLTWERYRDGVYDHLWAIVIVSAPRTPKIYEWIDLGERPDHFFHTEVHFQDNILKVIVDGNVMASYDVTYWEEEVNYFKAGIYINRFDDGGEGVVAYRELHFDHNSSHIVKD